MITAAISTYHSTCAAKPRPPSRSSRSKRTINAVIGSPFVEPLPPFPGGERAMRGDPPDGAAGRGDPRRRAQGTRAAIADHPVHAEHFTHSPLRAAAASGPRRGRIALEHGAGRSRFARRRPRPDRRAARQVRRTRLTAALKRPLARPATLLGSLLLE